MKQVIAVMVLLLSWSIVSAAKEAAPVMGDEARQERVMKLAGELRCLVCQGESLAESHSDFAADMLRKIRELMDQGKSDQEIKDYLVQRYGDFILYRPPLTSMTALVWFGPLILFVAGAGLLIFNLRRRRTRVTVTPLSEEEEVRVKKLLNEGDSKA